MGTGSFCFRRVASFEFSPAFERRVTLTEKVRRLATTERFAEIHASVKRRDYLRPRLSGFEKPV